MHSNVRVSLAVVALSCLASSAWAQQFSEIRIDMTGTDTQEYVELAGAPLTSLDGLSVVVVGDGTGASGTVERVYSLTGQTIDDSGFFVLAGANFTLGTADLVITPTQDIFENSDNLTFFLVSGTAPAVAADLDTNDDGTIDAATWTAEIDRIAFVEVENDALASGDEFHYGPPRVGPDGTFVPGHAFFCEETGWTIGQFDPTGGDDSPGALNLCRSVLVYGPGGTGSTAFFGEGIRFDSVDADTWPTLTTEDFGGYDAIWADGNNCQEGSSPFQVLVDSQATWGPAVTGRVAINIADPDLHANTGTGQADLYIENHSLWLTELGATGNGGATGMYLSTGCTHAEGNGGIPPLLDAYRPTFGSELTGVLDEDEPTAITADGATHPVLAGISLDPGLQWSSYCHGGISAFPASFVSLVTCPNGSGLIVRDVGCGNAVPDEGEECDDGALNGTSASCCTNECTFQDAGTACGDGTDDECTSPDTCNDVGVCLSNHEPEDTACGDPTDNECANPDTCDGNGLCFANDPEPGTECGVTECAAGECDGEGTCDVTPLEAGTACGSEDDTECSDPDSCDGEGTCSPNNEAPGTACGSNADTECDNPDQCTAEGTCGINNEPDGTTCTSDGVFCTGTEECTAGACASAGDPCDPETETCAEDLDLCILQCGDGMLDEADEACDDGNSLNLDGCSATCQIEFGWDCTDVAGEESACTATCGDGELAEGGEDCEDGGTEAGDGCAADCTVEPGWACEPDEETDLSVCVPICGDGLVEGDEDCDDGDIENGDGCDSVCQVEEGFVCDDEEPSECTPAADCGDGALDEGEDCDDGDVDSGDGCSAQCDEEPGFFCDDAEPTVCVPDADDDGIPDADDNCPNAANPDQADADDDDIGDACDPDRDNDDTDDVDDNCPDVANPNQADQDIDDIGDACDDDRDGDGLLNDAEPSLGTNPDDPDSDDDGLNDGEEVSLGTDPTDADTDDGGVRDGEEVVFGTDPRPGHGDDDFNFTGGKASEACATADAASVSPVALVLAALVVTAALRRRPRRRGPRHP